MQRQNLLYAQLQAFARRYTVESAEIAEQLTAQVLSDEAVPARFRDTLRTVLHCLE